MVVNLGGRDQIWAKVEVSGAKIGELSKLSEMVSDWVSVFFIRSWGAGRCGRGMRH